MLEESAGSKKLVENSVGKKTYDFFRELQIRSGSRFQQTYDYEYLYYTLKVLDAMRTTQEVLDS